MSKSATFRFPRRSRLARWQTVLTGCVGLVIAIAWIYTRTTGKPIHLPLGRSFAITFARDLVLCRSIVDWKSEEETSRGYSIVTTSVPPPPHVDWWSSFGVPQAPTFYSLDGTSRINRWSVSADGLTLSLGYLESTLVMPLRNILIILAALLIALIGIPRRFTRPGHCRTCGYDLTGNQSGRCPECGTPLGSAPKPA